MSGRLQQAGNGRGQRSASRGRARHLVAGSYKTGGYSAKGRATQRPVAAHSGGMAGWPGAGIQRSSDIPAARARWGLQNQDRTEGVLTLELQALERHAVGGVAITQSAAPVQGGAEGG